jgi:hypothetical protein
MTRNCRRIESVPPAVDSFGPVLCFACAAGFTAGRLSNYLARTSRLSTR